MVMLTTDPREIGRIRAIATQAVGAATEVLSAAINVEGWDYVAVLINGGTNAATGEDTAVVIKESATSGGTYSAVAGTSISYASTDDGKFKWGLMRTSALTVGTFIKVSATGGTGGTFTCGVIVELFNAKDSGAYTPALADATSGDVVAASFDVN